MVVLYCSTVNIKFSAFALLVSASNAHYISIFQPQRVSKVVATHTCEHAISLFELIFNFAHMCA